ncbi:S1 family peptidase [Streptomyces sp. HUAS TT20]|uniref:S1 family peptidase n=1 Tax=Streptomyces sp. HUAS TT20 TaxID=3447509 RepID=UPI0021DADEAE|nr:serine protease [Streptomyces sp. HUAS 15-9]UXY25206.1 serine protease [Streptomyces sp. HUAS 15-9]
MANAEAAGRKGARWDDSCRIAEVIVSRSEGRGRRASGYLVADGRVLTAWHPLAGASRVRVRFNADRQDEAVYEASVGWSDIGTDVAVLVFDPPAFDHSSALDQSAPSPGHVPSAQRPAPPTAPASFGCVGEGAAQVECMAFGFPLFKLREGVYRDLEAAEATCVPLSNRREGTLDLKIVRAPSPDDDPRRATRRTSADGSDGTDDGPYEPWAGMSGAAVFSRGRIIGVAIKHYASDGPALTAARIDSLQDRVPADELHRLEQLLGCGSLRGGALTDVGLPAFPRGIRTHRQTLARNSTRDKYLTGDQIPFVSPREGHEADPERLLTRLAAASAPGSRSLGVVLVGAAGTGKTRTCFEVAARADRQGWTVLHLAPKKPITAEELTGVVVRELHARNRDVLLVLDYLDGYEHLDLSDFADEVREERTSSARLACIASLRPGAVQRAAAIGRLRLLDQVEVSQEGEHQKAVATRILESVAKEAVGAYGTAALTAVCGHRPVLTLLIARAIESRVRDEAQDVLDLSGLRNLEDLSYWLRVRTGEDLGDSQTRLLASAVAATSCPQERMPVETAVGAFLDLHQDRGFTAGGIGVVGHLRKLGWLICSEGDVLDVIHDFVADELLQQALQPRAGQLEADAATRMFSAFLSSTHTLRLAADTVRRWSADLEPAVRDDVRQVCEQWLADEHGPAERLAAEDDLEETGRTLLTLLSGPPWQSGVVASWDSLVRPWLKRSEAEAPHLVRTLFTNAIRNTSDAVPAHLASAALEWQADNRHQPLETRPVLEALLRAPGVSAEHLDKAAEEAVEWLRQPVMMGGLPLASALLTRIDLPEDRIEQAVDRALSVVRRRLSASATAHVLRALLSKNLQGDRTGKALKLAFDWLRLHPDADTASFVLPELLKRDDLDEVQTRGVIDRSINWLASQGTSPLASFVLRNLLEHPALRGKPAETVVDLACTWLAERGTEHNATFVLDPLLSRVPADPDGKYDAVGLALTWLEEHSQCGDAYFVLRRLLEETEIPQEAAVRAAQHTMKWLTTGRHGTQETAKSVLGPLIKRRGLPEADEHCAAGVRWLDSPANLSGDDASFVLQPLLAHPRLGPHREPAARHALTWLKDHSESPNISYVLQHLLPLDARIGLPDHSPPADGEVTDAVGFALAWLTTGTRGTSPEARFVLAPLLKHRQVGAGAAPLALAWLAEDDNGTSNTASFVLEALLICRDLAEAPRTDTLHFALDWLETHHTAKNAQRILKHLPGCRVSDRELRQRAVERVLECVGHGHMGLTGRLPALCRLGLVPLPYETRTTLVDLALEKACSGQPMSSKANKVLRALLARTDLDPEQAGAVTARARVWLDEQESPSPFTGAILGPLLDPRLPASRQTERGAVVGRALAWLETYAGCRYAGHVLAALLEGPGLTQPQTEDCLTKAADWLSRPENTDIAMGDEHAARLAELLGRR